ncbi:MAG: hypothetical protein R2716_00885 [Microthrixaceae bacterium]
MNISRENSTFVMCKPDAVERLAWSARSSPASSARACAPPLELRTPDRELAEA